MFRHAVRALLYEALSGLSHDVVDIIAKYASELRWLGCFGCRGTDTGQFEAPVSVAISPQAQLYVCDSTRIRVFDLDGSFRQTLVMPNIDGPRGIAFRDSFRGSGKAIVIDCLQGLVSVTVPKPERAKRSIFGSAKHIAQLDKQPTGLCIYGSMLFVCAAGDRISCQRLSNKSVICVRGAQACAAYRNELYVSCPALNRLLVYDLDGTSAHGSAPVLSRTIGRLGAAEGRFDRPCGLAFDDYGRLFVCDTGNQRVQVLSSFGVECTFRAPHLHFSPTGVAVHSSGMVYVTDDVNHCVHVFGN